MSSDKRKPTRLLEQQGANGCGIPSKELDLPREITSIAPLRACSIRRLPVELLRQIFCLVVDAIFDVHELELECHSVDEEATSVMDEESLDQDDEEAEPENDGANEHISQESGGIKDPEYVSIDVLKRWNPRRAAFRQAQTLSHVCSQWSSVALSTTYLWKFMDIPLQSTSSAISALWEFMARLPPRKMSNITLNNLVPDKISPENLDNIRLCRLEVATPIDELEVELNYAYEALPLCDPDQIQFFCSCKYLALLAMDKKEGDSTQFTITDILCHFENVRSLKLQDFSNLTIGRASLERLSQIRTMVIIESDSFPILELLRAIPSLESLMLSRSTVRFTVLPQPFQTQLRALKVVFTDEHTWLKSISCPLLLTADIMDSISEDIVLDFLGRSPRLTSLQLRILPNARPGFVLELARRLPLLEHLDFMEDWLPMVGRQDFSLPPPFPRLVSLKIHTIYLWDENDEVDEDSLEALKNIIRTRCLPSSNPRSLLDTSTKPLETLTLERFEYSVIREAWEGIEDQILEDSTHRWIDYDENMRALVLKWM